MAILALHRLLEGGRSPDAPVAIGRAGVRRFGELVGRASALASRVSEAGGGRWLLAVGDPFGVAVALLGVAAGGGVVLLPPNRQPGTLERLARGAAGTLVEPGAAAPPGACGALAPEALAPEPAPDPRPLDPDAVMAELYTSGTSGEAKAIPKTLRQLDEVAALEETFGADLPAQAVVFSTASPHHLYGLLFRVLWPLASGRPFHPETLLLPDELLPRLAACPASVLASTPAHLRRLAARGDLGRLRGRCLRVFSSGGPLDGATADGVARALGAPPLEIFGSTETGGVAWREGGSASRPFTPLPGVDAALDAESGCLVVRSAFVSVGAVEAGEGRRALRMGDRAELHPDGRFTLLGRADRVVKVGEKRLALPEMESRLRAHPAVAEGCLLTLEQGGEARVAAVIVPSDLGREILAREGRRELVRELAEHLAPDFDRVLLPRAWRFLDELPRDARGKTALEALRGVFQQELP